ncbi:hypothetical protein pEaSNUABM40_00140 [Erwinia phage pEa_SNUABM_40]|uniref:Uncharacterized protein n=1 Tax=Erwinia phage pEa_SNUABM_3 TaxID=2869552 RepID=A0AAE8C041_9CAUD|nr:hypothetical protein MPK68_gp139 [Erwinia phage pEa_SNUABM_3]QZE56675.1 hypothetical protein pEaSNUABM20_00139 [Erwinia phage pEa_SNUABM_20]QZE58356.1 hypothetical protein pEaSNUABM40_00140 [Erwinia phage pEa_SNUABM_40]UAW52920.1 hypothetical protein pEaSNUABM23_00138 [Erwinia phage pEa_SNUABM_23]UIW10816.1 hypothetical protein pEaSNUABM23_00138 [Erwinia phage pEa_SNUABM_31]QZE56336.1 hypothetical protein pEaSNUABM3_00139 [Erwinia phage pEa_SNUABM_3]
MSANLAGMLKNSTSLKATIFGFQRQFRQGFNLKRFVWSVHNNPKQGIRATNNYSTDYPYGWFKLPTMAFDRELLGNPKNVSRHGSGWAIGEHDTNAIVVTNYYFPVTLSGTLFVKFMNVDQALLFSQQLLIASISELLSFKIIMPTAEWTVRVQVEGDSIPLPNIEDLDDGSTPGSFELEIPITIKTKIGFNLEQAKINNYGEITEDIEIDMDLPKAAAVEPDDEEEED